MKVIKPLVLICCLSFCGCTLVDLVTPELPPYNSRIAQAYLAVELNQSNSADVLSVIHIPEHELLSQSKSVIASTGQKKKGYKMWFNMVAFDENELIAKRKYILIEDEKPKAFLVTPWGYAIFECKMVLTDEILSEPYSNENARRVAILRYVLDTLRSDIKEVQPDNKMLGIAGGMINLGLDTVLIKLDKAPAYAAKLSQEKGLDFEHVNYDKGRIKMAVEGDIAKVEMKLGSIIKKRIGRPFGSIEDIAAGEM